MARPTWEAWALDLARTVATRADCTRRQVGAVIFDESWRVLAVGYNGAPAGAPGCASSGACPRGQQQASTVAPGSSYDTGAGACIALHAEQNALLYSDPLRRHTIAVSDEPCDGCARMLGGSGLQRLITPSGATLIGAR